MRKIAPFIVIAALAACSGSNSDQNFPKDPNDVHKERNGSLASAGGVRLFGEGDDSKYAGGQSLAVNAFLWRACLDTLSFIPLNSADPVGGTILSDWYENPDAPGERFKLNVLILDKKLRIDAVKVAVYKQVLDKNHNWRDSKVDPKIGRDLEDKILSRARELRITAQKNS